MKRLRQLLNDPTEDRGAALILVLFVVTVIGLGGAALLTFSDTSIRTTLALRDQAGNAYNADGAAQVAINSLSTGHGFTGSALFENATSTTCFGPNATSGTLNLKDFYPATNGSGTSSSASVECSADPASGVNGTTVPINSLNRPAQAILTLGTNASEDGINVKSLSGGIFAVKGAVKSNSNIRVVQGTLQSTAAVTAVTGCSGNVSSPAANCAATTNSTPNYASEALPFASPSPVVPIYRAVPANTSANCPGQVVTFDPGYYDDAKSLSDLMSGNGDCGGSTMWFKPGTYYFDFHNNTQDPDYYPGFNTGNSGAANQWLVKSGHLVAGNPVDINGDPTGTAPGASPTIPGSCQNPIHSSSALGVQFIFGGDSQLQVGGSADAEICGTYRATRPPIAVYGVKSGTATTTTFAAGSALKMSAVPSPQTTQFINPVNITEQDNTSATWVKSTASSQSSTITVAGYAPPLSAIPAGSIVKSATLRVRHGNSPGYVTTGSNKSILSLSFKAAGGTAIPLTPSLNSGPGLTTDSIDLYGGGTSAFVKSVHDNGFTGASVAYTATLKHAGTESLDAMQLDISYVTPAFRSEAIASISSNCMTQPYTGTSSAACSVLSTSSSYSGKFFIQGTTYTPLAVVDLTLSNITQQVLRFGVISRTLWIKETGALSYSGPVIEIPDSSPGGSAATIVFLTVYVCPGTSTPTCSTNPGKVKALRVKALINDPAPPSNMSILSWSNLR